MKKILAAVCCLSLSFCLFGNFTQSNKKALAASILYTTNFSNADKLNEEFKSYYLSAMGGVSEVNFIAEEAGGTENWYIKDNTINRQSVDGDINLNLGTNSAAILTYVGKKYVNFDLSVDYKMGEKTYYWPVVAFRQSDIGRYFLEDGAGVFVQSEGMVTVWGTDGVGGPYESSKIAGYSSEKNNWHNMRLTLVGKMLTVYLDNSATPAYTRILPSTIFKTGYISLISVNNDTSFRNLSIRELAVSDINDSEKEEPMQSADTDDSLDNLASKVEKIDELQGLKQDKENNESSGNKGNSCGALSMVNIYPTILALFGLSLIIKRKK